MRRQVCRCALSALVFGRMQCAPTLKERCTRPYALGFRTRGIRGLPEHRRRRELH